MTIFQHFAKVENSTFHHGCPVKKRIPEVWDLSGKRNGRTGPSRPAVCSFSVFVYAVRTLLIVSQRKEKENL